MKETIAQLQNLLPRVQKTLGALEIEDKKHRIVQLTTLSQEADFWKNNQRAKEIMQRLGSLKQQVDLWESLARDTKETLEMSREAEKERAEAMYPDLREKARELVRQFEKNEFQVLLGGKYDERNAIISIHAGAGGVDAQDWAEMLRRMLLRYAEKKDFSTALVEESRGGEAGIKSATFRVMGRFAYGMLQSEGGVHRLVRQSPFNSDALRQTSFALVEVIPEIEDPKEVEIDPEELRVDTFRSSGAGGQKVNKTSSAVRVTHLPSRLVVECQTERSQYQNKETALKILQAKLLARQQRQAEEERLKARGQHVSAGWGNQIRSYVLHPYKMVKDHRTNYEEKDPDRVLAGELTDFGESFLKWQVAQKGLNNK